MAKLVALDGDVTATAPMTTIEDTQSAEGVKDGSLVDDVEGGDAQAKAVLGEGDEDDAASSVMTAAGAADVAKAKAKTAAKKKDDKQDGDTSSKHEE